MVKYHFLEGIKLLVREDILLEKVGFALQFVLWF
jgi:hypothetical protein